MWQSKIAAERVEEKITAPTVGVFCSGDDKISQVYKDIAHNLGQKLAPSYKLVTGGSKTGLMKEVVDGFIKHAPQENVQGVIPQVFKGKDVTHGAINDNNMHWEETMHKRLAKFHTLCDAVVVLPGGFGTLHELMDFAVSNQFGIISQRIILLNVNGFWDGLLSQFQHMVQEKALKQEHLNILKIATDVEQVLGFLTQEKAVTKGLTDNYWEKKIEKPDQKVENAI